MGTEALSATWLYLDDQKMLVNAEANHYKQVELDLFPGWYDITLRFLDAGDHLHVYLYWQLPEETRELIPTRYLCPPAKGTWQ